MIFQNVVISKPLVEPCELLAYDEADWLENELKNTLFTETRFLPAIMKEAGLVQSAREVRRNRPELCIDLAGPDCMEVKWGKRQLYIVIGE